MKYYKSIIVSILILSFMTGSVPITGQTDKVEVTFWYTENSSEAPGVLALVNEFEQRNPDIDIKEEAKGFFSAKETYLTQFTAKLEPTVFRAARDWVIEFAQQGLIQPVTEFMNDTDKEDFIEDALRLVTYPDVNNQEQIWGWPHLVDGPALFYNKQLLEDAGINTTPLTTNNSLLWDEFTSMAQQIRDAELGTDEEPVYGFTFQGMFFGAQPAYYGHGARFFENDVVKFENININSTESRDALQFVKDVADADYTPPWAEQGWETINPLFMNGRVGFVQQGPWEIANFLQNSIEFNPELDDAKSYASEDNLGIMRLPHDEEGNEGAPLGGHAYVVSVRAEGEVQEAAMKFARWMSSNHAMSEGAIDYYHVPARNSVFNNSRLRSSSAWKYIETFKFIVDNSYKNPVDHRWAQLESVFATELDNYLAEEETLNEFTQFVTSFWGEILLEGGAGGTNGADTSTEPFNTWVMLAAIAILPTIFRRKKWS